MREVDDARKLLIADIHKLSNEGLSQREIAAELGISASTVNKYLKGD